jgi:hypothetical protein
MPEVELYGSAVPGTVVSSGSLVTPGGDAGVNAFNLTSGSFTVPAVGSTINVTLNDASWVVVGQFVYVDQAGGGVGQAGLMQVTVKTGNQLTLLNPTVPPAIPLADNTQSGLLRQVSGSTSDFVDGTNNCRSLGPAVGPAVWKGFTTKTAAYTLTTADSGKYIICSNGSWVLTLPAPALGLYYQIRNDQGISGTTGNITLQLTSGTIDGLNYRDILPAQECTLVTDGTNWRTLGLQRVVTLGTLDITSSTATAAVLLPIGYRVFEVDVTGFMPVTNGDYGKLLFSINGGSSWITSAYYMATVWNNSATTVTVTESANIAYLLLSPNQASAAGISEAHAIINPGNPSVATSALIQAGSRASTNVTQSYTTYGFCNQGATVNAIQISFSSGNIAKAYITVKGIV